MHKVTKNARTLLWVEVASSPEREAAQNEYRQQAGSLTESAMSYV